MTRMDRLLSGVMMAAGILIAGASGLCSGFFVVTSIVGPRGDVFIALFALIIGAPPFGLGLALFFTGRAWARRVTQSRDDQDTF